MVRLLTYLPGTPVAKITTNAQILYEIGRLAASLDKVLLEVSSHALASHFSLNRCLFSICSRACCLLFRPAKCKLVTADVNDSWLRCQPPSWLKPFPKYTTSDMVLVILLQCTFVP